jgi:hypothetical protein
VGRHNGVAWVDLGRCRRTGLDPVSVLPAPLIGAAVGMLAGVYPGMGRNNRAAGGAAPLTEIGQRTAGTLGFVGACGARKPGFGLDPTDEFCRPRWSVQVPAPAVDASVAYGQAKSDIRPCAKEEKEDV